MSSGEISKASLKPLLSAETIHSRVGELALEVSKAYTPDGCVVLGVLKGAFMFTADLVRHLQIPLELDFIRVQSYGNRMSSSGEVALIKDVEMDLAGKDVLIVDDIVETGYTQAFMLRHLAMFRPRSVKICALLWKKALLRVEVPVSFHGFTVGPEFIVGYGIDYAERFRELPDIYTVQEQ